MRFVGLFEVAGILLQPPSFLPPYPPFLYKSVPPGRRLLYWYHHHRFLLRSPSLETRRVGLAAATMAQICSLREFLRLNNIYATVIHMQTRDGRRWGWWGYDRIW